VTTAWKINVLFIATVLFLGCVVTAYTAYREYQIGLENLIEGSLARVASRPDLQIDIYRRDEASLNQLLADFLEQDAVAMAIAHDSLGEALAKRELADTPARRLPSFAAIRGHLSAIEPGLTALSPELESVDTGFWRSLAAGDSLLHLTMPVFTSVNPTAKGLTAPDFFKAMAGPEVKNSFVVIGYIQLGIQRQALLRDIQPVVTRVFIGSLVLLIVLATLVFIMTRRLTVPLSQLGQLADQIAAGEVTKTVKIEGGKEFKEIAYVLNNLIGGVSSYKKEIATDHKLLSWRVDESASKLSTRNEELSKATEEITETRDQLHQVSYYDNLTALPNRRLFTEQLNLLLRLSERSHKPLALMFLNLDNFKRINDSLGHSAGDLLLKEVAKRLTECLRNSDMLAHHVEAGPRIDVSRLGGDEFTVVLNQLDTIDSAGLVAQRVIDNLVEPMQIEGHELVVTPSVGIATAPRDAADVDGLLRAAGIAMHHAKASSRKDFLFYTEEMDGAGLDYLKLESDLRKAVERQELVLHYQPQVDTANGSIVGAEALLRWEHPEFGLILPFRFISLAEEIGLIDELGDWVLVEACRQLKEFKEQGLELPRIAINVSTIQFNSAFMDRVKEVLVQADLPPSMLELGLSEGILMDNDSKTIRALEEIKEMGVYLSVDNFGTGYAPLGALSRYPLDELKIDRSFVSDCDRREERARLVTAITAMAKSLKLHMVAEGVETAGEYQFLASNGVRVMQGYLFSKPVTASELQRQLVVPWHFMVDIQRIALTTELKN
jgi:diguanylate cyclase (GGDEF)-like protein